MRKYSRKGFSAIETLLLLVIVGLVAFVVWYVFNTKSNTNNNLDLTGSTQISPPVSKNTKTSTTASKVVETKTDSAGTQYLVDASGKTLYTYGADTSGVSNCSGSCLTAWPVYTAASTTGLPTNVTVITRSDNTKQYAYKGLPLYYFTGDTSAGMVTGDGVSDFHLAKP